jgi:hypothetical protein
VTRALAALAGLLIAALIATGIWLYVSLDHIIKRAVESYVPEIIGAPVELDEVTLSASEGSGTLRGLRVGNPKGFSAPRAVSAGNIEIAVAPNTITKGVVLVRRVAVSSPSITYEPGKAGSNFDVMQRNVQRYLGSGEAKEPDRRKFIVETLTIRNAKVVYAAPVGRGSATISFDLPDIHLRDIGKNRGGVTAGELAKVIIDALAARIAETMARSAIQRGIGDLLSR